MELISGQAGAAGAAEAAAGAASAQETGAGAGTEGGERQADKRSGKEWTDEMEAAMRGVEDEADVQVRRGNGKGSVDLRTKDWRKSGA